MATSTDIKKRALELASKTDINSINPQEVGGLFYDITGYGEEVQRNGGTLGIRKVYASVSAMEADSTSPVDMWGNPMRKGNLCVIYDGTQEGIDNNKVFAFKDPGWEIATHVDAGYATRSELVNLDDNVGISEYPAFSVEQNYNAGDVVNYEGNLYEFTADHAKGAWIGTDAKDISLKKKTDSELNKLKENVYSFNSVDFTISESKQLSNGVENVGFAMLIDGSLSEQTNFSVTDFIEVSPKTYDYVFNNSQVLTNYFTLIMMYDSNKNKIASIIGGNNGYSPNTFRKVNIDINTKYIKFTHKTGDNASIYEYPKKQGIINVSSPNSINLFNKFGDNIYNYYIDSLGNIVQLSGWFITHYIPISEGQVVEINQGEGETARIEQYDWEFKAINGTNVPVSDKTITGVEGARYFRVSAITSKKDSLIISYNSVPNKYVTYNEWDDKYNVYDNLKFRPSSITEEMLSHIDVGTTENGIFGETPVGISDDFYFTSDYIDVSNIEWSPLYLYLKDSFSSYFSIIKFYDKDRKELLSLKGGKVSEYSITKKIIELIPPKSTQYIKYSQRTSDKETSGLFFLKEYRNIEQVISAVQEKVFADTNNILWIGTSIPAGAEYPHQASTKCGYNCINKSVGSSQVRFTGIHPSTVQSYSGYNLSATVDELEILYRQDVTNGTITEDTLNKWKSYSYENSLLPYIDGTNETQVSMIVFDHGFNDRTSIKEIIDDIDNIDWETRDRSNYIGACNYVFDKILEKNPFVKIVICGYFQDKYAPYYSKEICQMQEIMSEHYGFSLLPAWKHSQINDLYVKGTSNYLSTFNEGYSTNYTAMQQDSEGNIISLQLYCPDRVHPHSDLSGNCNKRLNAVYSKLLSDLI